MSPDIPPEAEVIRLAREATGMTAQDAAEASRARDGKGVSAAYWRDVERGYGGRRGQRVPTRASARALAAMARVTGVAPAQLAGAGREDAARVLAEILRREGSVPPRPAPPPRREAAPAGSDPDLHPWRQQVLREVYAVAGLSFGPGDVPEPGDIPRAGEILPGIDGELVFTAGYEQDAWNSTTMTLERKIDTIAKIRKVWAWAEEEERRRSGTGLIAGNYRRISVAGTVSRASH